MKKSSKYLKKKAGKKNTRLVLILSAVAGILLLGIIIMILMLLGKNESPVQTIPEGTTIHAESEAILTTAPLETTLPEETVAADPDMLAEMAQLYARNPDVMGWIRIEGTKVDYPVMFTPNEPDKYLYKNFDGKMDFNGSLYIEEACHFDPESENIIIYGHNMNDGSMFENILKYRYADFVQEHPIIEYSTLYEKREYEVMAAFYGEINPKDEDAFRFYRFVDVKDEETFQKGYSYIMENSEVNTGVTAQLGDRFIMLVTCTDNNPNVRFVVMGKLVNPAE